MVLKETASQGAVGVRGQLMAELESGGMSRLLHQREELKGL
jgi:hypothetical protein